MTFTRQFELAKAASREIARVPVMQKNLLLQSITVLLEKSLDDIIAANGNDLAASNNEKLLDRLRLNEKRIHAIAQDVRNVASLPEKVGEMIEERRMPNGIKLSRVRVPLGVIGMIYESRPNVTIDSTILALKSGNAIVLKGGKEARNTNRVLVGLVRQALINADITPEAVQFLDTDDREASLALLKAHQFIDAVIPRGGKALIEFAITNATVPVIQTGAGVVHTFIDKSANLAKAVTIVINEKTRRPAVCNAVDTVLVHADVADTFLPQLAAAFTSAHSDIDTRPVCIHADPVACDILAASGYSDIVALSPADLDTEWLDYVLNVKLVNSLDEALEVIATHSSGHSESVCSEDPAVIARFLQEVDSACVFANVSTAFADGGEFGLGAEIGISTQKLHTRGPFALEGLTTYKWLIEGNGQIRS